MSSQQQSRYSYKFALPARKLESGAEEPSKVEIQAYINEVLGIKKEKSERPS